MKMKPRTIATLVVAALIVLAPAVLGKFGVSLLNDIGIGALVALGLVSYPLTAVGALAVGVVESFGSFWSGALKDVIVFSLLIPVLLLRSALARHAEEEVEEIDA